MKPFRAFRVVAVAGLVCVTVIAAVAARSNRPTRNRYEKTAPAMGTFVTVSVWADTQSAAETAADAALETIGALEHLLSSFDPESDVSRINSAAPGSATEVSPETAEVLAIAADVSGRTGGAFDVTVGPLVALWRTSGESETLPSQAQVAEALSLVSYKEVSVDRETHAVRLSRPGVRVDLAAIAKGYIAGAAADKMKRAGVESGFVNAGGDITFIGANPDGSPWRAGVADPRDDSEIIETLYVADRAVVTSGNYEQYSVIDGRRYSHIIDPRTGMALEGSKAPASVTTIAESAAAADAWATALSVMGAEGAEAAGDAGVEFLMLFVEDGELRRVESKGLDRYLKAATAPQESLAQ